MAVVVGNRGAAEMLHTFFRLMELDCALVNPDSEAVSNVRRLAPDILILDLDLPDLRALEIARESRRIRPALPIIFLTDGEPKPVDEIANSVVVPRPGSQFEELLGLFEVVLGVGC